MGAISHTNRRRLVIVVPRKTARKVGSNRYIGIIAGAGVKVQPRNRKNETALARQSRSSIRRCSELRAERVHRMANFANLGNACRGSSLSFFLHRLSLWSPRFEGRRT